MLLLDTCTLLWLAGGHPRLSSAAREAISTQARQVYISTISGFEIAQEVAKGKLILLQDPADWMEGVLHSHGLKILTLEMDSAIAAGALPALHADPFDRLLIASAQKHGLNAVDTRSTHSAVPWVEHNVVTAAVLPRAAR